MKSTQRCPMSFIPDGKIFRHVNERQFRNVHVPDGLGVPFLSYQIPGLLHEEEIKYVEETTVTPLIFLSWVCSLGRINKIFAAQWLSGRQIVFGTKCNKVQTRLLVVLLQHKFDS